MAEIEHRPVRVRLVVDVDVENPAALIQFAKDQYAKCWSNPDWEPKDLGEAVYEALIASNMNPSPVEYGIGLGNHVSHEIIGPADTPGIAPIQHD